MRPTQANRSFGLDLMRSVAVIVVVLYHLPVVPANPAIHFLFQNGWAGVDLFFVLSGYLIGAQVLRSQLEGAQFIRKFYFRRLARTLPNYYVVLFGVYVFGSLAAFGKPEPLLKYVTFSQNFGFLPAFAPSWSLCVEEHFYLLFPWVALALKEAGSRIRLARWVPVLLGAIVLAGMVLRASFWAWKRFDLIALNNPDVAYVQFCTWIYYLTPCRLDGIVIGIGLAAIQGFRPEAWNRMVSRPVWLAGFGAAVLALAAVALHQRMSFVGVTFGFPLLATGFGALVAASTRLNGVRGLNRMVHGIAQLAFAVYLLNLPIIQTLAPRLSSRGIGVLSFEGLGILFGSIFLASGGLYLIVERPFLRLRDRLGASVSPVPVA